ncbi:MAG: hypothetical protein QOK36_3551, partial [Gaiellales bacterium]|nr:hypothetical protein [Gaiellales bacterium]
MSRVPRADDADERRVPIGEAASGEDEVEAPTGLPPEQRLRAPTV